MDAVLLSGFAKIKKGQRVLDMGTGTGIIPILLRSKTPGEHFTGLEIQKECAEMARRSVAYNDLEKDIDIVCGDIKEAAEIFGAASFHAVTCNPPYMIGQHGLQNPHMPKAIARHEDPLYTGGCGEPDIPGIKRPGTFLHGTSSLPAGGDFSGIVKV